MKNDTYLECYLMVKRWHKTKRTSKRLEYYTHGHYVIVTVGPILNPIRKISYCNLTPSTVNRIKKLACSI